MELDSWIRSELPQDGQWWKESTQTVFANAAWKMMSKGVDENTTKEILEQLYNGMLAEFGS